jgi:hypothetical protein
VPELRPGLFPLLLGCTLLCSPLLCAQEYSYDGNRWYEVEVSIFANEHQSSRYSETTAPDLVRPEYLPRLQQLRTLASSYTLPFPADQIVAPFQPQPQPLLIEPLQAWQLQLRNGPLFSPALRESFRVPDPARDPYMELDVRGSTFLAMNRNLAINGRYRVLWHKLWRQPMQGRAQGQSVFVTGGTAHGAHRELEGSLRLSDNAGRVMLDVNLWLVSFVRGVAAPDPEWQLPALPYNTAEPAAAGFTSAATFANNPAANISSGAVATVEEWVVTEVWQQQQSRELGAGQLYLLDHPTLGVLVEVRPYVLPQRLAEENQEDF